METLPNPQRRQAGEEFRPTPPVGSVAVAEQYYNSFWKIPQIDRLCDVKGTSCQGVMWDFAHPATRATGFLRSAPLSYRRDLTLFRTLRR